MLDQHIVRRTLLLGGIGAVAAAGLVGPGAASANADSCPDVQVVFARGTAEPAGLGREGQAFVDDLRSDLGSQSVVASAVNYPASYDFLQSAPAGASDASAQVQGIANSCPNTKIVLGGYSQGAAVVDLIAGDPAQTFGFGQPMPADVANHVAAVAVFGNPAGHIGKNLATSSPLYGAKTIDLCNGGDPICSGGDDRAAHSQYVESGLVSQGASFAAGRLSGDAPSNPVIDASSTVG